MVDSSSSFLNLYKINGGNIKLISNNKRNRRRIEHHTWELGSKDIWAWKSWAVTKGTRNNTRGMNNETRTTNSNARGANTNTRVNINAKGTNNNVRTSEQHKKTWVSMQKDLGNNTRKFEQQPKKTWLIVIKTILKSFIIFNRVMSNVRQTTVSLQNPSLW